MLELTTADPTDSETGLTAGAAAAILVTGPGRVLLEVQDGNAAWVPIHEGSSPGCTVPVLPGTAVRATLLPGSGATADVTITQP